tara:strand:- start:674 stop:1225 length:552 start_codon:yes stop_codon:yes gene_type:complete
MLETWRATFQHLRKTYIDHPMYEMIHNPNPIWRYLGTCFDEYVHRNITLILVTDTIFVFAFWWNFFYTRDRDMARQCYIIQRIMDKPSSPGRDEVILDIRVELNNAYVNRKAIQQWNGELLMDIPGAEEHWEKKNPGWWRNKYHFPDGRPDKFDTRVLTWGRSWKCPARTHRKDESTVEKVQP